MIKLFFDLDGTTGDQDKNVKSVLNELINIIPELSLLNPNDAYFQFKSINGKLWSHIKNYGYSVKHLHKRRFFLWMNFFYR